MDPVLDRVIEVLDPVRDLRGVFDGDHVDEVMRSGHVQNMQI